MPVPRTRLGKILPVVITYYNDKSFSFIIKTPPATVQLMEAAKVKGGSGGKPQEGCIRSLGAGKGNC